MFHYSLPYETAIELPVKMFWLMSANISRIQAENDIRQMAVAIGASNERGFQPLNEKLTKELGTVMKDTSDPVHEGSKMRALMGKIKNQDSKRKR